MSVNVMALGDRPSTPLASHVDEESPVSMPSFCMDPCHWSLSQEHPCLGTHTDLRVTIPFHHFELLSERSRSGLRADKAENHTANSVQEIPGTLQVEGPPRRDISSTSFSEATEQTQLLQGWKVCAVR